MPANELTRLTDAVRVAARNMQTTAGLIDNAYRMDISAMPIDVQTTLQCMSADAAKLNRDVKRTLRTLEELAAR